MQHTPTAHVENQYNDGIDLLELFGTLLDHKWLIASVTAAFCIVGVGYATLSPPIYMANALVQAEKKNSGIPGLSDMSDVFGGESKTVTEIELIKSRTVIGKAVDNLKLDIHSRPQRFPIIGDYLAQHFTPHTAGEVAPALMGMDSYAWGGEQIDVFQLKVPQHLIDQPLTLIAGTDGQFNLFDSNKQLLLQGQTGQVIDSNGIRLQISKLTARPGTHFMLRQQSRLGSILRYQGSLIIAEQVRDSGLISLALKDSDPQHAIRVLDEISQQFVRQNVERMSAEAASSIEFLRGQLPTVRRDLEQAETELNTFRKKSSSVDITMETSAVLNQSVELETRISELKLQQAEYDRKYTRQHPMYLALLTQIEGLTRRQNELAGTVKKLPETQQELLRLSRAVEVSTEIYTQLLNKAQELDIARAGTVGNVRVVDSAVIGLNNPVAPKKGLIIAVAILLGALLSIGFVLVRKMLNPGLETPESIEQLGLPVYATIPLSPHQISIEEQARKSRKDSSPPLLASSHPNDLAIESLRSLRTSLHFAMLETNNNCLMISGPSPAVGKSFVSANLAAVIAQTDQRVLLVDVDMRKGHLHKHFQLDVNNGLSDLLARRCNFEQAVRPTQIKGLYVLPRGEIPPNPSELLMHANFTTFLKQASQAFDLVILDTPPLLAVTDAAIVGRQAGTSLIVTRFGVNPAREIQLTLRRFAQNGVDIKGAIFNGIEKRASSYGGYHYYQYEYSSDKA